MAIPDEFLIDEISGTKVKNQHYLDYQEGAEDERVRIEAMFADNEGMITFIRKRDGKAGVENCKLIIVDEWQALKVCHEN